jgi:hypothetical protein
MRPVYDEFREGFTVRIGIWAAILGSAAGTMLLVGTMAARPQAQNQPQPAQAGQMRGMSKPSAPAGLLKIVFGDKSAEWTPATLAMLPHQTVTVINSHTKASLTYSGVPLIELLKRLGVPSKPQGKELKLYLVAKGSDGYEAVYSLAEAAPELHNATVIVADTLDGKPLADGGPLQLVTTGDKGLSRCVRSLASIRVLTANEGDTSETPQRRAPGGTDLP